MFRLSGACRGVFCEAIWRSKTPQPRTKKGPPTTLDTTDLAAAHALITHIRAAQRAIAAYTTDDPSDMTLAVLCGHEEGLLHQLAAFTGGTAMAAVQVLALRPERRIGDQPPSSGEAALLDAILDNLRNAG